MIEALWSAFSHPDTIAGRDGAGTLALLALLVALVTSGFMAMIGRRIMPYSPALAILSGCAFVPLLMNLGAFAVALAGPAGTDGGGILMFAALVLSLAALPVTFAVSITYVVFRKRAAR